MIYVILMIISCEVILYQKIKNKTLIWKQLKFL
jgi:hypothetical protein